MEAAERWVVRTGTQTACVGERRRNEERVLRLGTDAGGWDIHGDGETLGDAPKRLPRCARSDRSTDTKTTGRSGSNFSRDFN